MPSTAVQAHRGSPDAGAGIAENTLASFDRARRLGADGVELDVRMTTDHGLAVHPDPAIDGLGPICDLRADELPAHVPLLAVVLDACAGLTVNIELKDLPGEPGYDPGDRLASAVADLVVAAGRISSVVVSSFWPDSLSAVRRAAPAVPTGLLVASWFDPRACVTAAVDRACTALHLHESLATGPLVDEAHSAGLSVAVWTVNGRPRIEALAGLGVETVITDDVALARAVLDAT